MSSLSPDDLTKIATAFAMRGTPVFRPLLGLSRTITGIVAAGTRSVFVKCATSPAEARELARERAVLEALNGATGPRLLGALMLTPGPAIVCEDLSEAAWGSPVPTSAGKMLAGALERIAATPVPASVWPPEWQSDRWAAVAASRIEKLVELGIASRAWWEKALPRLIDAERRVELAGDAICHGDIWRANVAFAGAGPKGSGRVGRVVLVDYGDAVRANPDLDRAMAAFFLLEAGRDASAVTPERLGDWGALLTGGLALAATGPAPRWAREPELTRAGQREGLARAIPLTASLLRITTPR
jgi:hypothetical protein